MTWTEDANGNKCSAQYFGTEQSAQMALDSLKNCKNCINCSGCSECYDCSGCARCSECSDCSGCARCYDCSGCSECDRCSRCARCYDCSGCSGCYECSRCCGCSGCSECARCSDCSRCSGCSECYDCSNIAWLHEKKELKGDPESTWSGPPQIPKIEDIHKKIYAAASITPDALAMHTWHTCGTTHCRGGWAVHLAGKPGYTLEKYHGTLLAAQLIYRESGYPISPVRFFDSNEDALADMKRLAEV